MSYPKLSGTQSTLLSIFFHNLWVLFEQENQEVQYTVQLSFIVNDK